MNINKVLIKGHRLGAAFAAKKMTMLMPLQRLSTTAPLLKDPLDENEYKDYTKIHKLYAKFQRDDGIPVHLKGGQLDQFFLSTTILAIIVGLPWILYTLYPLAFPHHFKNKK